MGKVPTWTRLDLVDTFENQDRNAFEIWQKADVKSHFFSYIKILENNDVL